MAENINSHATRPGPASPGNNMHAATVGGEPGANNQSSPRRGAGASSDPRDQHFQEACAILRKLLPDGANINTSPPRPPDSNTQQLTARDYATFAELSSASKSDPSLLRMCQILAHLDQSLAKLGSLPPLDISSSTGKIGAGQDGALSGGATSAAAAAGGATTTAGAFHGASAGTTSTGNAQERGESSSSSPNARRAAQTHDALERVLKMKVMLDHDFLMSELGTTRLDEESTYSNFTVTLFFWAPTRHRNLK